MLGLDYFLNKQDGRRRSSFIACLRMVDAKNGCQVGAKWIVANDVGQERAQMVKGGCVTLSKTCPAATSLGTSMNFRRCSL